MLANSLKKLRIDDEKEQGGAPPAKQAKSNIESNFSPWLRG